MKNSWKKFVLILSITGMLLPLILMPFLGFEKKENATAAPVPQVMKQGKLNLHFFTEAGTYFGENFAGRNEMVSLCNLLETNLFHSVFQKNVIVGKKGYLYYASSLDDYQKQNILSRRKQINIVHNISLLQQTLEAHGISFLFLIAPNKNSLYRQYMPTYYQKSSQRIAANTSETSNASELQQLFSKEKISYLNVFSLFRQQKEVLYHKTDSHWNNKGAALVNDAIQQALQKENHHVQEVENAGDSQTVKNARENQTTKKVHDGQETKNAGEDYHWTVKNDFQGDLYHMLFPAFRDHEKEYYPQKKWDYTYDSPIQSTFDPMIMTTNPQKKGNIVMFRDSFGNSLLPFVAQEYQKGYFSRSLPVAADIAISRGADTVVWEIVERNLPLLQEKAPIMPVQQVRGIKIPDFVLPSYQGTMLVKKDTYLSVSGDLDANQVSMGIQTYLYLKKKADTKTYLFPTYQEKGSRQDGYGYHADIAMKELSPGDYELSLVTREGEAWSRTPCMKQCHISAADAAQQKTAHAGQTAGNEKSQNDSNETGQTTGNEKSQNDSNETGQTTGRGESQSAGKISNNKNIKRIAQQYIGKKIQQLIQDIGKPDSYSIGASCQTDGEDGQYRWKGCTVYTQSQKRGGTQIIQSVK